MLHNAVELSRMVCQPFSLIHGDVPPIVDLLGNAVLHVIVPALVAQLGVQLCRCFSATRGLSNDLTPELEGVDIIPKFSA